MILDWFLSSTRETNGLTFFAWYSHRDLFVLRRLRAQPKGTPLHYYRVAPLANKPETLHMLCFLAQIQGRVIIAAELRLCA